jgi:hypothetical protein
LDPLDDRGPWIERGEGRYAEIGKIPCASSATSVTERTLT